MLTDEEFLRALGLFLKEKRVQARLTQKDVSMEMGYTTPQFISNWERGLIAPPIATIRSLIAMYKCEAQEVYDFIANEQLKILRKELIGQQNIKVKKGLTHN